MLAKGELAKSIDPLNRLIVFIGCGSVGNIVIFHRYRSGERGYIVFNAPPEAGRAAGQVGGDGNPTLDDFLEKGINAL